jgi:hypothetical protein
VSVSSGPAAAKKPCYHDSTRGDGTLDNCCLRCGAAGYWHQGNRLDETHPSGKILFRLPMKAKRDD